MNEVEDLPDGIYNVGIKLSGGADSSLVYYALCNKFKNNNNVNIIPITLNTDLKPYYIPYAKKIIDIVENLTGKKPLDHITKTIVHNPIEYSLEQDRMLNYATKKYHIKYWFSGLTVNPPCDEMIKYFTDNHNSLNINLSKILNSIDTRDKSRDISTYVSNEFAKRPFGNKDKKYVAECYKKYNVMDTLYPYTHSCEDVVSFDNNGNALHCGSCYFCAERWWGFGRLI